MNIQDCTQKKDLIHDVSVYTYTLYSVTWSYSEDPGYSGHPRNNSAITHPRDHVSMASQNGRPRITSGALLK